MLPLIDLRSHCDAGRPDGTSTYKAEIRVCLENMWNQKLVCKNFPNLAYVIKKKKKKPSEIFLNLKTILEIALHFQKYIETTLMSHQK